MESRSGLWGCFSSFLLFFTIEVFIVDSNDSGSWLGNRPLCDRECGAIVPKAAMEWNEPVVCGREP